MRAHWRQLALGLAIAALLSIGIGCGVAEPTATEPTGDPGEIGRRLFVQKGCVACHGGNAEGGMGPRLAGTALTLEEVERQLRSPRGQMPVYPESRLSAEELRAIYAYLKNQGGG